MLFSTLFRGYHISITGQQMVGYPLCVARAEGSVCSIQRHRALDIQQSQDVMYHTKAGLRGL